MKGKRILVLRPAGKAEAMVRALKRKGAIPVVVPAVAIVPVEDASHIDQAIKAVDPSRLENGPAICCIGPPTAEACKESGLEVTVVAEEHTTAGLVKAMENYFAQREPG